MRWFVNKIILWLLKNKHNKYIRGAKDTSKYQEKKVLELISRNKNSKYGKKYDFSNIKSIDDYRRIVPIINYEDIEEYILLMLEGKENTLFCERVTLLEETSGSTTSKKFIPYNKSLQNEYNRAIYTWLYDLVKQHNFLNGSLYFSITPIVTKNNANNLVGFNDDSDYIGIVGKIIRKYFAVPNDVRFIDDEEKFKIVSCIFLFGRDDLSLVSIWNASFFLNLLKCFEENKDIILESIKKREILIDINNNLKKKLNKYLVTNSDRYNELVRITKDKKYSYEELFSKLEVISVWGDADSLNMYEKLQDLFPNIYIQKKGLLATEGVVSIPFCDYDGHLISYLSHFYEFEDVDTKKVLLIGELKKNKRYEIIITTGAGLYRYRLGDLIEVIGFYESIPIIKLIGRNKVSDYVGEKLNEIFVNNILNKVLAKKTLFYFLSPEYINGKYQYYLYIEFIDRTDKNKKLTDIIDKELRNNFHYDYAVKIGQLEELKVVFIKNGNESYFNRCQHEFKQKLGDIKQTTFSNKLGWKDYFVEVEE